MPDAQGAHAVADRDPLQDAIRCRIDLGHGTVLARDPQPAGTEGQSDGRGADIEHRHLALAAPDARHGPAPGCASQTDPAPVTAGPGAEVRRCCAVMAFAFASITPTAPAAMPIGWSRRTGGSRRRPRHRPAGGGRGDDHPPPMRRRGRAPARTGRRRLRMQPGLGLGVHLQDVWAGSSSEGSCRSIRSWRSRSSALGSTPTSSTRRRRLYIRVQCLGLATGPIQGEHPLSVEPLAQRVLSDESLQPRKHVLTLREPGLDRQLGSPDPQLVEPTDLRGRERLTGDIGQGGAAPQREGSSAAWFDPASRPAPARRAARNTRRRRRRRRRAAHIHDHG